MQWCDVATIPGNPKFHTLSCVHLDAIASNLRDLDSMVTRCKGISIGLAERRRLVTPHDDAKNNLYNYNSAVKLFH